MSKVQTIEAELQTLSPDELRQVRVWLDDILEDELEFTGEFEAKIRASEQDMAQPDFLSRAKSIWGEQPAGKTLSELVADGRGSKS